MVWLSMKAIAVLPNFLKLFREAAVFVPFLQQFTELHRYAHEFSLLLPLGQPYYCLGMGNANRGSTP
jgi:hypothetical protein